MSYFINFPISYYKFGNEKSYNTFQNISAYVDIIDQAKENTSLYTYYNLIDGERPDQLSQKLYGTVDFYWTFFALNDHLKKYGWPIDDKDIPEFVKKKYPNTTLVSYDYFYDKFDIGERVQGVTSGEIGIVRDKISDLGQVIIEGTVNFEDGETIETIDRDSNDMRSIKIEYSTPEYLAVHHYERNSEWVDIDPTTPIGSEIIPIIREDYYLKLNQDRKVIKIFRDDSVRSIYSAYNKFLKQTEVI